MKKLHTVLAITLAAATLSACTPPAPPVAASSQVQAASSVPASDTPPAPLPEEDAQASEMPEEQPGTLLEQIDALYAQLDTTPLPLLEDDRYSLDPNHGVDELPPQLVIDTPEAYMLANQVRKFLYFGGNILEDFNNPNDALSPPILKTALYRTAPIDYKVLEDIIGTDHILAELVEREAKNGRRPDEIYYTDEVEAVVHYLFGDEVQVGHMDIEPYYFFRQAGVYTLPRNVRAQWWSYPQITLIEKTAEGYICEAVMVMALDKQTPMEARGSNVPLTRENFEQESVNAPKYRYTFREEADGRLTLQAFKTLRDPSRDNAKG